MSDRQEAIAKAAEAALGDEEKLKSLVDALALDSRRERQIAASTFSVIAKNEPQILVDYIDNFIDALNRPEAQTRWEMLETLAILVEFDARACNKAIP